MVMEGLNLLAGSLAKTQAAKPAGVSAWAIVTGTVPLTVQLLDDPQGNTIYVAANAAGPVEVGWAVLVEIQNNRVTLRSSPRSMDPITNGLASLATRATRLERKAFDSTVTGTALVDIAGGKAAGLYVGAATLNYPLAGFDSKPTISGHFNGSASSIRNLGWATTTLTPTSAVLQFNNLGPSSTAFTGVPFCWSATGFVP